MRAVNLLPREVEQARKAPPAPLIAGCAGLVLAAAVLAAGYLSASAKVGRANDRVSALQAQLLAVPRPAAAPASVSGLPVERQARVAALSSALGRRVAWDRLLREVSLVLPDDVWLTTLTAKTPASLVPGAAPLAPDDTTGFSLQGYTYSQEGVARLLSRLQVIPDLQSVALLTSTQTKVADRPVYQFSIGGSVRPPGATS